MQRELQDNDIAHVRGQFHVARALEVAAAGRHNIVLLGSPGVGKAMLARTLQTLVPATETPFYEPQPEVEDDEIPAQGLLFIRDMQRWKTRDLTRIWQKRRTTGHMIASIEPCPCGYYGNPLIECTCPVQRIVHHVRRNAPFLNDFDICSEVPLLSCEELLNTRERETSERVRSRIEKARLKQTQRGMINTAYTTLEQVQEMLDSSAEKLLRAAIRQLHLTPRTVVRTLCIARTVADLADTPAITAPSLAEAIQYRPRVTRG